MFLLKTLLLSTNRKYFLIYVYLNSKKDVRQGVKTYIVYCDEEKKNMNEKMGGK